MFFHNFKYTLKTLFRNKALIFWTFAFPIILGTLFKLAFSNIENKEKLDIIDIAIVDDQNFEDSPVYKEVFKTLGDKESYTYRSKGYVERGRMLDAYRLHNSFNLYLLQ